MVTHMATEDLVKKRRRADVTQSELAAELGISERALQYFESGEKPMPRERTLLDYLEAVEAIKARRQAQKAS